jgi:hypothetical protein
MLMQKTETLTTETLIEDVEKLRRRAQPEGRRSPSLKLWREENKKKCCEEMRV